MRRTPVLALAALVSLAASPAAAQGPLASDALYTPPDCSSAPYGDVAAGDPACRWIKQLQADQITSGCGGGRFCPQAPVTREQMAMLLGKAMRGTDTWDPWRGIYKRTLIVGPVPGNPLASGARLYVVVGSIDDSSSTNSYLVFVEPGNYNLGGGDLNLPPYVTLMGAGLERTVIYTGHVGAAIVGAEGTVIESVTVRNQAAGLTTVAIDLPAGSSGKVRNVDARASGASQWSIGIRCSASCTIEDTEAMGSGSPANVGINAAGGSTTATLRGVRAIGFSGGVSHGVHAQGGADINMEGGRAEATFGDANWAVNVAGGTTVLRGVVAHATPGGSTISAGARVLSGGRLTVENSHIEAENIGGTRYGLMCVLDGEASVHNSRLVGAHATVYGSFGCSIDVGTSQLVGGSVDENGGTVRCALNYSEVFNVVTSGCFDGPAAVALLPAPSRTNEEAPVMKLPAMLTLVLAASAHSLQAQASLAAASLYVPPACSVAPYSDVSVGNNFCPWIQLLKVDQITSGCAPGAFCPEQPVTREQMASLLGRALRGTAAWNPASAIFKRILIASPVNGNNLASGQRLLEIIATITDSASNQQYLVLIEPGTYDLDDEQIVVPPYVTLLGSGRDRTSIQTDRNGPAILSGEATVIESLTVQNFGAGGQVVGIDVPSGLSPGPIVRNVFASASGGSVAVGMRCSGSCTIEDSELRGFATSSSTGVFISGGFSVQGFLRRVTAKGISGTTAYGMYFSGARVTVEGGRAEATFADNNWALNVVANSQTVVRDLTTLATSSSGGTASAGARLQSGGHLTAENSRLESDDFAGTRYGLLCVEGTASVHNSRLLGVNSTVFGDSDCAIDVAGSQLAGGAVDANGGTVRCALNYSEVLNVVTSGCF